MMIADVVYPPNCILTGNGLINSTAGQNASIFVQLVDFFGNEITKNLNLTWFINIQHVNSTYNTSGNLKCRTYL